MANIEFRGYMEDNSFMDEEDEFVIEKVIVDSGYIEYLNYLISDRRLRIHYEEDDNYSRIYRDKNGKIIFNFIDDLRKICSTAFYHSLGSYWNSSRLDTINLIETDNYSFRNELYGILNEFKSIGVDDIPIDKDGKNKHVSQKLFKDFFEKVEKTNSPHLIEQLVAIISKLKELYTKINISHDLFFYKDELFSSLMDVCSKDDFEHYKNEYEFLMSQKPCDLDKLYRLYGKLQKLIISDWNNKITNPIDYRPGEAFNFVCHSIRSVGEYGGWKKDRGKDFDGRFVSASLITERNQIPYVSNYGFILDPKDIISSSPKDLYTDNSSYNISSLYTTSDRVIPELTSIEKVSQSQELNEVVVDGFKPVGIFCLTNGTKELNWDYLAAKKIHELFPELPIIDIDVTLYKNSDELLDEKKKVIDDIISYLNIIPFDYSSHIDDFWTAFTDLKINGNYSLYDIINIFNKFVYDKHIEEVKKSQEYSEMYEQALKDNEEFDRKKAEEDRLVNEIYARVEEEAREYSKMYEQAIKENQEFDRRKVEEAREYSEMYEQALKENEEFDRRKEEERHQSLLGKEAQLRQEWKDNMSEESYYNYKTSIKDRLEYENAKKLYDDVSNSNALLSEIKKINKAKHFSDETKEELISEIESSKRVK